VRGADPGTHRIAAVAVAVVEEGDGARVEGFAARRLEPRRGADPDPAQRRTCATTRASGRCPAAGSMPARRRRKRPARAGRGGGPGARREQRARPPRRLRHPLGLRDHAGGGLGRRGARSVANPAEVESIHRIAVREFMRSDAPLLDPIADSAHPVLRMPVGTSWIAAPTAAVLYQFRELCIAGRPTAVGHFEQPLFARR
jgi:hypothetical protein